jgi:hypothetical protein
VTIDLAEVQKNNISDTIVITGSARSGTTLLGRLISSLQGVEYHYEPPMFWMLCSMLSAKAIEPSAAAWLLRYYLHEELLCESAMGRRANLRPYDDSLVLNAIHWPELVSRMVSIRNRADALKAIQEKKLRLAVKMPHVLDVVPLIADMLPKSRFVLIIRSGHDVVRSVLKKGWMSEEGLRDNWYPYKVVGGRNIPHMVEDDLAEAWSGWSAGTRACYVWRKDADLALSLINGPLRSRIHLIAYEQLVSNTELVMQEISTFLALTPTDLTRASIMSVRSPVGGKATPHARSSGLFGDVDKEQLRLFDEANAVWNYS